MSNPGRKRRGRSRACTHDIRQNIMVMQVNVLLLLYGGGRRTNFFYCVSGVEFGDVIRQDASYVYAQ